MSFHVHRFRDNDAAATAGIFFDSVRHGAAGHYDEAQLRAWAPAVPELSAWRARLEPQIVFVAERGDVLIGFMSLTKAGCIDLAFVRPDAMGQGVATALYRHIHAAALQDGLTRLHTDASRLARPFFERLGWIVMKRQTVTRNGVALENFVMEREIAGPGKPLTRTGR